MDKFDKTASGRIMSGVRLNKDVFDECDSFAGSYGLLRSSPIFLRVFSDYFRDCA